MSAAPSDRLPGEETGQAPGCPAAAGGVRDRGDGRFAGAVRLYGPEVEGDFARVEAHLRGLYGPVAPVLLPGDVPAWLLLGYEVNQTAMRGWPVPFSRDPRNWNQSLGPDHPLAPLTTWAPLPNLTDGDEHERLRGAITHALAGFDRRLVSELAAGHAHRLVDGFAPAGSADLATYAEELPLRVIADLLGMAPEQVPYLVSLVRDTVTGSPSAASSHQRIDVLLDDLIALKLAQPGIDITTFLIQYKVRPRPGRAAAFAGEVGHEELRQQLRLLLTVTGTPTATLLATTLCTLVTSQQVRTDIETRRMTLAQEVERQLWYKPPFPRLVGRWAMQDTKLGGCHLRKGDMVVHAIAAANAEVADRFEGPVHANSSHLTFSTGDHKCPGQDLGRAIVATGVETLLARLPDCWLAPGAAVVETQALMSHTLYSLPVVFSPQQPRA
ncbi:cytochrome P450 [Streptomyces qinglanensis]|uniref:cytochrome P450 n=1 Tax=Streptomyces qinglanensis TaxID=943816 RepID=UPI003D719F84